MQEDVAMMLEGWNEMDKEGKSIESTTSDEWADELQKWETAN